MIPHTQLSDNGDDDIFSPAKLRKVNREGGDGVATKVALKTEQKEEKKATHDTGTINDDENVSDDDDDDDDDEDETGTIKNDKDVIDDNDDDDDNNEDEVIEDFFAQYQHGPGVYKVIFGKCDNTEEKEETIETEKKENSEN